MHPRTTTSGRATAPANPSHRRRGPLAGRRPGIYLGVAAAGAVLVNVLVGPQPAATAEAGTATESVAVAEALGLSSQSGPAETTPADLQPLEDLAATRSTREAAETAAQQSQAAADQATVDRQRAEAEAAARAAEEAAAAQAAAEAAAAAQAAEAAAAAEQAEAEAAEAEHAEEAGGGQPSAGTATVASSTAASVVARITNTAGSVKPQVQAAADTVVSNVPGADGITLGGTRASAADPGGHPSGLALDYMVMTDAALGDAIVAYHRAHWDELGVDYLIWQQRMLSSPNGSWSMMEDRGGTTANHYDHVHVNYQ
ncbi:hypothetical protein JD79_03219 [Geodermatophilus normandii]|uniref:ARB-07466-like C-terminal domain-containing protein n=1 Tax=Geodermatophilus normandii TaxID=1137989 RepID=A0A317QMX0_9ACTN|nr:hypothetical protein [Geodermatophilus normandii]PWW24041.1 hypothetical protein JD79_03219 [Geodermatophilus normandii]